MIFSHRFSWDARAALPSLNLASLALSLQNAAESAGRIAALRDCWIGPRSLGGEASHVVSLVLRQGGRLIGLGLVIGMAGSLALTRFLGALLYGITPNDPLTYVAVAVLIATVALGASVRPACVPCNSTRPGGCSATRVIIVSRHESPGWLSRSVDHRTPSIGEVSSIG